MGLMQKKPKIAFLASVLMMLQGGRMHQGAWGEGPHPWLGSCLSRCTLCMLWWGEQALLTAKFASFLPKSAAGMNITPL